MYSFKNDYSEGACEEILQALIHTNQRQTDGYGLDEICLEAKKLIQKELNHTQNDIHFLVGGTQANTIIIASALRPYEAVISADSGHINVHETGAIEASGHKVVIAKSKDGKLLPEGIKEVMEHHLDEHMVKPKMVYISNATEIGTIYTKQELQALRNICDAYDLYLFMDGARLAQALVSEENDLTLQQCCELCDVFYIGGTKNGALFGEAVVITNDSLKEHFRYMIKQRGGMLAKGRLLGLQFKALFQNQVYLKNARHAVKMAQKIQQAMQKKGIPFFALTSTNQIFPILDQKQILFLKQFFSFQIWEELNEEQSAVRFVTSWATQEEMVDVLIEKLQEM